MMSIMSRLMARVAKLPPAETYDIGVEKDLAIPMPDGVSLLADHYYPRNIGPRPTIMTRSVYTDRTKGAWVIELYAERGFHVLAVSGRGTVGSGGELNPFLQEHDDGLAVLAWLKQQPWFSGVLGTAGASYLGYTQWAIARDAGSMLQAMSTQLIGSDFRSIIYPGDAFALETFQGWLAMVDMQERPLLQYLGGLIIGARRRRQVLWHLPLGSLDVMTVGKRVPFFHDWLSHDRPDDSWWAAGDHRGSVASVAAPNHLIGAWYDFMLPFLLKDNQALQAAGTGRT
jgi:putative CocE/NonD family hydrolase